MALQAGQRAPAHRQVSAQAPIGFGHHVVAAVHGAGREELVVLVVLAQAGTWLCMRMGWLKANMVDNRTVHLQGAHKRGSNPAQVWPEADIDALPSELRNYRVVLWDTKAEVLVFVPSDAMQGADGAKRWRKIVMRPNSKGKFGAPLSVVSLGSVQARNLTEPHYVPLVGRVPKE